MIVNLWLLLTLSFQSVCGDNVRRNYRDEVDVGDHQRPAEIDAENLQLLLLTENFLRQLQQLHALEPPPNFRRQIHGEPRPVIPRHCVEWVIFAFVLLLFFVAIFLPLKITS